MREAADALLSQQPHEELQADEGEDAEAEDGQDHHVCQLPHGLDQSTDDGLQTFDGGEETIYESDIYRQLIFNN